VGNGGLTDPAGMSRLFAAETGRTMTITGQSAGVTRTMQLAIAVFTAALLAPRAFAAPILYGNHAGTHFTYTNVSEDSTTDTPPLFGPPIVTGDSIDFNPLGFDASTTNGGSDPTVGNLVFSVEAHLGSRIESIILNEVGDISLAGNVAPGSMGTAAAVFASGTLDIHEVDFAGINHISVPFSFTFSPSGGTFFLGTDGGGGPLYNTNWSGSVTIPIDAILIANGITGNGATKVSLDIVNTLETVSEPLTSATITKTDFGAVATRTEVRNDIPEPTSATLLIVAVAPLLGRRRLRD
jgi:hypothetical protein